MNSFSQQVQYTNSRENSTSSTAHPPERNIAKNFNNYFGNIEDKELAKIDDQIQKLTEEYRKRKGAGRNQQQSMTSHNQIIDLTQDDDPEEFDTIPDDAFLSIQNPDRQNNSQKKRRVTKNPYKK